MDEKHLWALFFSGLYSFQFHPGAGTKDHTKLTMQECAALADHMVRLLNQRYDP